jgi:hypothetical protein
MSQSETKLIQILHEDELSKLSCVVVKPCIWTGKQEILFLSGKISYADGLIEPNKVTEIKRFKTWCLSVPDCQGSTELVLTHAINDGRLFKIVDENPIEVDTKTNSTIFRVLS